MGNRKNPVPHKCVELLLVAIVKGLYEILLLLKNRSAVPKRTNVSTINPHSLKVGTGASGFFTQALHCVNNVPPGLANT
jgi:hypothetical protein